MKCSHCGFANDNDAVFCAHCGNQLVSQEVNDKTTSEQVDSNATANKSNKGNRKRTLFYSLIAVVPLLLIVGYLYGRDYYSLESQTERYVEVLNSGDAVLVAEQIDSEDPNFEVTEETIAPFVNYLSDNTNQMNNLRSELLDSVYYENANSDIYLKETGNNFLIFDNYDLMVNTIYPEVVNNYAGTEISLNGETVHTVSEDSYSTEIGPLAPGNHDFNVYHENNGFPLEADYETQLLNASSNNEVYLNIEGVNFIVESNIDDATVYLNNEEIGQLTGGFGEFGPLPWQEDSYLRVEKEFPTETLVSGEVKLEDYDTTYTFPLFDAHDNDLLIVWEEFIYQVESLYYDDSDYLYENLEELINDGRENDLYNQVVNTADEVRNHEDFYNHHIFLNSVEIDRVDAYSYELHYELEQEFLFEMDSDIDPVYDVYQGTVNIVAEEEDSFDGYQNYYLFIDSISSQIIE